MIRSSAQISITAAILTGMALLLSCGKSKNVPEPVETPFDKQAMLVNIADHLIIPVYADLNRSLDSVSNALSSFTAQPSLASLSRLRSRFDESYVMHQRASLFGFGPGEDQAIRVNLNVFPTDTSKINSNIAAGSYNLSAASNIAAKGFPAIDFLLYGSGSDAGTVTRLSSPARYAYLSALVADMKGRAGQALASWNGGYRASFVASLGADIGSSIGNLVNQLSYELDYLKNAKVATPLGLKSDGIPKPDNSESYYGRRSNKLMMETFNTIENVYYGRSFGGNNGAGLDDYLIHLDLRHSHDQLHWAIANQFNLTREKLNAITAEMPIAVTAQKEAVNSAYKELVRLLVLLKTDMPSGLGIVITYQDGDGD